MHVRIALHTGEADRRAGDYYGPAVNRCARLRTIAHGGQILLSLSTQELVRDALPPDVTLRDMEMHRLRDLTRPERVFQLLHPALRADFPPLKSLSAPPNNLPMQLTSFVGREKEMAQIRPLLDRTRLLTLTGAGGYGKSRLALQVVAGLLEAYPDGGWRVELAGVADPVFVPQAVASALHVCEESNRDLMETLSAYLKPKRLLLVLDNCEHLIAACARLADALLRACPDLCIVATSREGLGILGETTWRVPPISLPARKHLPPYPSWRTMRRFVCSWSGRHPPCPISP